MKKHKKTPVKVTEETVNRFVNFMACITLAQANLSNIMKTEFFQGRAQKQVVHNFFKFWDKQEQKVVKMLYTDDETALQYENACAGCEILADRMAKLTPFHMHMIGHLIDHMLDSSKEGLVVDFQSKVLEYQKLEVFMALNSNLKKCNVDDLKHFVFSVADEGFADVNYRVVGWTLDGVGGDRLDFQVIESGNVYKNTLFQSCPVAALLELNNYIYLKVLGNEPTPLETADTANSQAEPDKEEI